jgi:hypothetical protein
VFLQKLPKYLVNFIDPCEIKVVKGKNQLGVQKITKHLEAVLWRSTVQQYDSCNI